MRGVRRSSLVGLVAAVACAAAGAAGVRASDSGQDYEVSRGQLGAPTVAQDGEVTVSDVRVGTSLTADGAVTGSTPGLFIVVHVSGAATGPNRFVLNESRLLADGDRVYSLYDDSTLSAAPGFVQDLDYLFEVDPAALDDLTLEVSQSEIVHGYQSRVQVHLGITPANAAAWRTAGQGRALEPDLDGSTRAVP